MLFKVDFISLVNLIMGKEVVRELIQNDFNEKAVRTELDKLLNDREYRKEMTASLNELKIKLGGAGASQKAAGLMFSYLRS
jgi:lipid-A-disaccharide synthase